MEKSQNTPQVTAVPRLLQDQNFPDGIIKGRMLAASTVRQAGDLYFINAQGNFQRLAPGANGTKLTIVGGLPAWI